MQILPKILHIHMYELYSHSFINLPRKSCETVRELSPLAAECAESSKNILLEREAQERKQEEEEGTS
jgi:hypothetical protein